jgi:hypothetical protein
MKEKYVKSYTSKHEKMLSKHNSLVDLVFLALDSLELDPHKHVEYSHGEMDVYCNGIYYECKCNYTNKTVDKAKRQIIRAIQNKQCEYGYLVTYQGFFDILNSS